MSVDNIAYLEAARICQDETKGITNINGATIVLLPQPISMSMISASQDTGGNAIGLRPRQQLCESTQPFWHAHEADASRRAHNQHRMESCL